MKDSQSDKQGTSTCSDDVDELAKKSPLEGEARSLDHVMFIVFKYIRDTCYHNGNLLHFVCNLVFAQIINSFFSQES